MAELSASIKAKSNSINTVRSQVSSNHNSSLKPCYNRLKSSWDGKQQTKFVDSFTRTNSDTSAVINGLLILRNSMNSLANAVAQAEREEKATQRR